jgi:hypothetical protein
MSGYTLTDNSITCHTCGRTSANPNDIRERYCGHCHVFHDDAAGAEPLVTEALTRELRALAPMGPIGLRPETVLQLVGLLQLALRHPRVPPEIRQTAETFIDAGREYFSGSPTVLETIRLGDDPNEDV